MFKRNRADAPRCTYGELTSRALLQRGDVEGARLAVTWVDVAPGGAQRPHAHEPEQIYVVTRGQGRMHIGDETRAVEAGDLIYIPSGEKHYAENAGREALTYISAATPSIDVTAAYDRWNQSSGR